jgi:predicted phage terminase large subunit-like protein
VEEVKTDAVIVDKDRLLLDRIYQAIDVAPLDIHPYRDAFSHIRNMSEKRREGEQTYGYKLTEESRRLRGKLAVAAKLARANGNTSFKANAFVLNKQIMCWEGTDVFDSFLLYVESNRQYEKQFYLPRRKQLLPLVEALQDLADRKLRLLAISMPPGAGKTTLALFFLCWLSGRDPQKPMLTGSHNKDFLSGVYGELLRMLSPDGEYLWSDVFPELKVINTNAKTLMIDIGKDEKSGKRFTTLEFTSVGSGNAGKVRAENLLYCDDLVDGLETALSKDRLDKLWGMYATDLRQRKIGDCAELHIATRWSVHDVIGRLEQMYGNDPEARFIVMPALDENDESNFDYPIEAGFTTEFYHQQREVMDDASWRALYMNQPIEREGQLYPEETLRRYFELPDGEPDGIIAVCDTKDKGSDYCVLPIAYIYGQDFYIEDMVCDNSTPDVVDTRLVMKLMEHKVQMARFESNSAGGRIAEKVQAEIKARGGRTKITTKWTTANKETKIIMASEFVKQRCLFKDNSVLKDNKEYRSFMKFLTSYTLVGKNKHDDVPDAMAQLANYAESFTMSKAEVFSSPWGR